MAQSYQLGTQALIDIARNKITPVHRWIEDNQLALDSVVVSSISFSQFHYQVQQIPTDNPQHKVWGELYAATLARFRSAGTILPVTLDIALRLAEIRPLKLQAVHPGTGERHDLAVSSRLVLATALEENLTLVDRHEPCHDVLKAHGLVLIDPYETGS